MKKSVLFLILLLSLPSFGLQQCGEKSVMTGYIFKLKNEFWTLHHEPNIKSDLIINQVATQNSSTTHYIHVDNSCTIKELCYENGWSYIKVLTPEYLVDSHQGWIESKVLKRYKIGKDNFFDFVEKDFYFSSNSKQYKELIIKAVNKIHRENSECRTIFPDTASLITDKWEPKKVLFGVQCGSYPNDFIFNFSKEDIEKNIKFIPLSHLDKNIAIQKCEEYAKSISLYSDSLKFYRGSSLSISEKPNGRTQINTTVEAKDRYDGYIKYNIDCLVDSKGNVQGNATKALGQR